MAVVGDGLQFLQYLQGSGNLVGDPDERHIGAPHVNLAIQLAGLEAHGLVVHDLEEDVNAFTSPLPRVRIIRYS